MKACERLTLPSTSSPADGATLLSDPWVTRARDRFLGRAMVVDGVSDARLGGLEFFGVDRSTPTASATPSLPGQLRQCPRARCPVLAWSCKPDNGGRHGERSEHRLQAVVLGVGVVVGLGVLEFHQL